MSEHAPTVSRGASVGAGHRLSMQFHAEKDETSHLLSGQLLLEQGDSAERMKRRLLDLGATWRNAPGVVHTIEALEDSLILEISTPELRDVIRVEDRYGRETESSRCSPAGPPYRRVGRDGQSN